MQDAVASSIQAAFITIFLTKQKLVKIMNVMKTWNDAGM